MGSINHSGKNASNEPNGKAENSSITDSGNQIEDGANKNTRVDVQKEEISPRYESINVEKVRDIYFMLSMRMVGVRKTLVSQERIFKIVENLLGNDDCKQAE